MAIPKDIIVVTTSTIEGLIVKKYLKPVSAHIVAGTNMFSDFFASISDVFGGRSSTYQKQLVSLYNEAIERVKVAAYEVGANCVLGLSIDMDEISGKGKSMFMLTAVGTAVIVEKDKNESSSGFSKSEPIGLVTIDRMLNLKKRKEIIEKAEQENLSVTDDIWEFISTNRVHEVYSYLLKRFSRRIEVEIENPTEFSKFYTSFKIYLDSLSDEVKLSLLYTSIASEKNDRLVSELSNLIDDLGLLDLDRILSLLNSDNFGVRKRSLRLIFSDKQFYDLDDLEKLKAIKKIIESSFTERGVRTTKKLLLSSKEKEIWNCECGKEGQEIGSYCNGCYKDIFGFLANESQPEKAITEIDLKISLLSECLS